MPKRTTAQVLGEGVFDALDDMSKSIATQIIESDKQYSRAKLEKQKAVLNMITGGQFTRGGKRITPGEKAGMIQTGAVPQDIEFDKAAAGKKGGFEMTTELAEWYKANGVPVPESLIGQNIPSASVLTAPMTQAGRKDQLAMSKRRFELQLQRFDASIYNAAKKSVLNSMPELGGYEPDPQAEAELYGSYYDKLVNEINARKGKTGPTKDEIKRKTGPAQSIVSKYKSGELGQEDAGNSIRDLIIEGKITKEEGIKLWKELGFK